MSEGLQSASYYEEMEGGLSEIGWIVVTLDMAACGP